MLLFGPSPRILTHATPMTTVHVSYYSRPYSYFACEECLRLRCSLCSGGEAGRAAEAGGQQDGVRAARLSDRAGRRLRARARAVSGVEALQGVHVQLGAQVDEHRAAPRGPAAQAARDGRLRRLLQGRLRDHPQEVRISLSLSLSIEYSLTQIFTHSHREETDPC